MRSTHLAYGLIVSAALLFGCEEDVGGGPSNSSGSGGQATGGSAGSGGTSSQGGQSQGGQSQGGGGSSASHCPIVTLDSTVPVSYQGSTVGKPNIVTSARLEWTDAGDDALLYIAPATGTYGLTTLLPIGVSCGASIREYGPNMDGMGDIYDSSWCPAEGSVAFIDGVDAVGYFDLTQGQEMLVWVSCASHSMPDETDYSVTIFQP